MTESDIWNEISTGKFWASGGVVYLRPKNRAHQSTSAPIQVMMTLGTAVPGDRDDAVYGGCTWDTSIGFTDHNIVYRDDEDHKPAMFKPDLRRCIDAFLSKEAKEFIMNSFERAHSAMKRYCTGEFVVSAMIATKPVTSLPMHIHAKKHNLTFTYFVSSNTNKPNTFVVVSLPNGQNIEMPYPESKEFFGVLDTGLWHGVKTLAGDNNYYIYFVFDGIELLDNSSLDLHKFYTVQ